MEMLPHSNPLRLDVYEDASLNDAITDELRERFRVDPPRISLPIMWDFEMTFDDGSVGKGEDGRGGPPVDDPLTLYLDLPLAEEEEGVVFKCSLQDVINDLLDSSIPGNSTDGKVTDASAKIICCRVAARLRELAEHVEQALASEVDKE